MDLTVASLDSLLKSAVVRFRASPVTGVEVSLSKEVTPSFRLSPTQTGAVTARSPSPCVTRM